MVNSSQAVFNSAFSSARGGIASIWFLGNIANGVENAPIVSEVDVDAEVGTRDCVIKLGKSSVCACWSGEERKESLDERGAHCFCGVVSPKI